ncbi:MULTISPECIES: FecCD family ABC transporter permease [Anoxybacillus]|uniref:Iron ABC transporter permease n=1 Tax=Anoxybacillus flavithermus TaxID=33934 RepID=A0AAX2A1V4_9BACL|nr:iron ABC transporter permease [Anoxybacillus flavithermus]ASA95633.1 iron ABC transporter permease [Anoxybacillus flavithermus]ELK22194.1 cobalamin/Fe3+-siderophore ABC transporter permease [Anoxybacillus flavithermus TNO-09.006]MBE2904383.1 iron ABC transporter permease [Anoxybacillus flavithermus]MBE2907404.1 iron ABC transporter permease [Anoxybacillus flavithermus]MBE2910160.1 iron ABC transporter permease [Anoxybacillus flavithermus]
MPKSFIQTFLNNYMTASIIAIVALLLGISIGSQSIPFSSIWDTLSHHLFHTPMDVPATISQIIIAIRVPRVVLAFLIGASLALAGVAFQGLLKNVLADPYTIGVSSGAAVGAVLVFFFQLHLSFLGRFTLPIVSIMCALVTLLFVLLFARLAERNMGIETIVLIGIIMNAFFGSVISLMVALSGEELRQVISWLMGSVAMRGWSYVSLFVPFFIIGSLGLFTHIRELNAFSFGERTAANIGVHVLRKKLWILLSASLLTGAAVAVSGTIGFVGLVIPHMTRLICGANHRKLLPLSFLYGGTFLVLADVVARTIVAPRELPIGVITSFIGAPLFAILLFKSLRRKT